MYDIVDSSLDSMWLWLFLLSIKFLILLEDFLTVLISILLRVFSMMSDIELLNKMIYLCNILSFLKKMF